MTYEAFPAFGQSFRMLSTSILTLSASGMVSTSLVYANQATNSDALRWSYVATVFLFGLAILSMAIAAAIGAYLELQEGNGGPDQREINYRKFSIAKFAIALFSLGVVALLSFLMIFVFGI